MALISQNGYPALLPTSSKLYTWSLPLDSRTEPEILRLRMRNGSCGFNLAHLAMRVDARVEDINHDKIPDDWGHAFRVVRGYSILSNHASGTAIDLNATQHPLGVDHTWTTAEINKINLWLAHAYSVDGVACIRWGQNYHGRVDGMHFESNAPMEYQERLAKRLMETPRGKRLIGFNPYQRAVIEQ